MQLLPVKLDLFLLRRGIMISAGSRWFWPKFYSRRRIGRGGWWVLIGPLFVAYAPPIGAR